jgi:hypothetical protein
LRESSTWLRIILGAGIFFVLSLFLTVVGFQKLTFSKNLGHFLHPFHVILFIFWFLQKISSRFPSLEHPKLFFKNKLLKWEVILFAAVVALPLLPYLFSPAPPDCDISSQAEITGYLMQGQSLHPIAIGVPGEWWTIRYSAGLSALTWFSVSILDAQASTGLYLLWILTFLLFVFLLREIAKGLKISTLWLRLFTLNTTLTSAYSFAGGQLQEMMAYTLGAGMLFHN